MAATPLSNKYRLSGKERWDVVSDRRERRCGWAVWSDFGCIWYQVRSETAHRSKLQAGYKPLPEKF